MAEETLDPEHQSQGDTKEGNNCNAYQPKSVVCYTLCMQLRKPEKQSPVTQLELWFVLLLFLAASK